MAKGTPMRVDDEFEVAINKIIGERIVRGIDKRAESGRRMTKAIARMINRQPVLKETLILSELEDDRKFKMPTKRRID